jgi:hypothetical protein
MKAGDSAAYAFTNVKRAASAARFSGPHGMSAVLCLFGRSVCSLLKSMSEALSNQLTSYCELHLGLRSSKELLIALPVHIFGDCLVDFCTIV